MFNNSPKKIILETFLRINELMFQSNNSQPQVNGQTCLANGSNGTTANTGNTQVRDGDFCKH